jgi:hypothetical protein
MVFGTSFLMGRGGGGGEGGLKMFSAFAQSMF